MKNSHQPSFFSFFPLFIGLSAMMAVVISHHSVIILSTQMAVFLTKGPRLASASSGSFCKFPRRKLAVPPEETVSSPRGNSEFPRLLHEGNCRYTKVFPAIWLAKMYGFQKKVMA